MATLIENSGMYALYQNSDGSYFVEGNGEKEVIRDYGNITINSNVVAADLFNGYRTVVFDGGHIWYADSDWSKENIGPNNQGVADSDFQATGQSYRDFYGVDLSYPSQTVDDYYESDSGGGSGGDDGGASGGGLDEALLLASAGPFEVLEAIGSFKLHYGTGNSTYWVEDVSGGGSWSLIKQMGGNDFPSGVDSIIAADYFNGVRAVLFSSPGTNPNDPGASYHIWYANSSWEKDSVGPSGLEAVNISAAEVIENFGSVLPGYTGGSSGVSINNITDFVNSTVVEGESIWLTIRTDQAPIASSISYSISGSGINAADLAIPLSGVIGVPNIQNSPLPASGSVDYYALLEETGRSNFSGFSYPAHLIAVGDYRFEIPVLVDSQVEGNEFIQLTIDTGFDTETKIISIEDSELDLMVVSVTSNVSEIREGEGSIVFSIQTSGYDVGSTVEYSISGVSSIDITGGALTGNAFIDGTGMASISVTPVADDLVEANGETLTFSAGEYSSSVTILDPLDLADPIDEITDENLANGSYTLDLIADVFGTILHLTGLTESVTDSTHTIEYNGQTFNYSEVDSFIMTVVRDDEFTGEFAQEISESFPLHAGISYATAVALLGVNNIDSTILMVAGYDGNYVG